MDSIKSIWQKLIGVRNNAEESAEKMDNIPRDEHVSNSSKGPLAQSKLNKLPEMEKLSQLFDQAWQLAQRKEFARIYQQCYPALELVLPDQHFGMGFGRIEQVIIEHAKFLFATQTSEQDLHNLYLQLDQSMKYRKIDFRTQEFLKCILEKKSAFSSISSIFIFWLQQQTHLQTPQTITHLQDIPEKWLSPFPEDLKKLFGAVNQKMWQSKQEKIQTEKAARQQFINLLSKFCPRREGRFSKEDSFERLGRELKEGIEEFIGEKVETIRKLEEKIETNNLKAMGLIEKYGRECEKRDIQIFQQREEKNEWDQQLDALLSSLLHHDDKLKSLNEASSRRTQALQQQKGQLQNEINYANQKLSQIQIQHEQSVKKMVQEHSANLDKLQKKNQNVKDLLKAQTDDIQHLTRERNLAQDKFDQSSREYCSIRAKYHELQLKFQGCHPYDKLFSHQILLKQAAHKKFLAEALKDRYGSKVSHTILLCQLDPNNNTNFHKYLDKIPCIMIITRLQNERLVAGFSLSPFVRGSKGEDSLLFSITNRKVFFLKKGIKSITSITYDDHYLIFGTSDLRFKTGEKKAWSSFAVNNGSSFQNGGNSVDILWGMGPQKREAAIISYEIFQVMFENDLHLKYSVK